MRVPLFFLCMCIAALSFGQGVTVKNIYAVSSKEQGQFMRPQFSSEENQVLITKGNFSGLYLLNITDKSIQQISDEAGAGYEPFLNRDKNEVYYRPFTLNKGRKLYDLVKYDLKKMNKEILSKGIRELVILNSPAGGVTTITSLIALSL